MTQQVNLYQPIFRAQPKVFSAVTLLQTGAAVLIGLLAIYGYARWQVQRLDRQVAPLQARQEALMKQIEDFNQRFPVKQKSPELEKQLTGLTEERAGKARALDVLSGGVSGNIQGFSVYLEGLARRRVEGVWLTGVSIGAGGEELGFTGSTVDAQRLPQYLQQLAAEAVFSGREFQTFQMVRADSHVDFTLHTGAQGAPGRQP